MLRNADTQTVHDARPNVNMYKQIGYIEYESSTGASVSETLELSFDDFGISQVAKLLNLTNSHQDFLNRSKFYKNLWNK
jgi:putative alpha-1,2-mannosidase